MLEKTKIVLNFILKISVMILLLINPFISISIAETDNLPYYILIDNNTGNVIKENHPDHPCHPASLTKLMTSYVVFSLLKRKKISLATPIFISKHASIQEPSKSPFNQGRVLTLDNALKLLNVKSANDIAVAIAESIYGTESKFVEQMNNIAKKMRLSSTNFMNSNGITKYGHYSTARDMAILSWRIKTEFPQYLNYFKIKGITIDGKQYPNTNWAIGTYPGADGMKTGFTCASGFNIIVSASQNEKSVIAVVLGATDRNIRNNVSKNLLSIGLNNKTNKQIPNHIIKNSYKQDLSDEVTDLSAKVCISTNNSINYQAYINEVNEKKKYFDNFDVITLLDNAKSYKQANDHDKKHNTHIL
ncbi:D-alanyl-D-alanine carboxypeptidase family protein [Candidatus Liberibacter americanus]|uniref:D-alanyl-D-alanine carboxypeptidase n=1 Tax=Candidatus Liberibacter americanus str. Sao Paulo TaxID=1261131 RepID=U6B6S3_9HYPH|nr:D-alanyl-D-alanine carboxypeptidase family protein [Candidatus Liberibacter americanus]AHA27447.1 D-alanyl-D-alanine carboxypeptidase [Candidatus Liberibacter americanus str. Sao Paulo]EMS36720.1 peptidase S11, D-alanyl-D-alanine carboxypeptidase 1 [Candidatus Liberibacter americanus PW_SP]